MKIAIVGFTHYDSIEFHLNESFNYNGHSSRIFDMPQCDISQKLNIKNFMDMAQDIDQYHPNLIIVVYRITHPDLVIRLKQKGYKLIHINPDALTTFDLQQLFVAEYDVYFTKDPYIKRFMETNLKLNVKLYNEAFNGRVHIKPDIDKLEYEKNFDIDVITYGSMYPYRNRILRILTDHGIDVVLFGKRDHAFYDPSLDRYHSGDYTVGETKTKILYGSRIVFNILNYAEIESVNNRFFEINGPGAFQLLDCRPILKDLLPVDPELVNF
jgi:spore maturation protein CgeB